MLNLSKQQVYDTLVRVIAIYLFRHYDYTARSIVFMKKGYGLQMNEKETSVFDFCFKRSEVFPLFYELSEDSVAIQLECRIGVKFFIGQSLQ